MSAEADKEIARRVHECVAALNSALTCAADADIEVKLDLNSIEMRMLKDKVSRRLVQVTTLKVIGP